MSDPVIVAPEPNPHSVPLRAMWNYDRDLASDEAGLDCQADPEDLSVTQQQFKEECDINEIVRRFGLTGQLPENPRPPMSGDFSGVNDFKSAMDAITRAQEAFMEFPAETRARFANDPQRMLEFMEDAENLAEARKLGLVLPEPEKTRDVIQAVDELAQKLVINKPA